MIVAVADTHAAVWYLFNNPKLSATARQVIEQALRDGDQIGVSAISLAEMVYLAEKGRIPATAVSDLIRALSDPDYPLQELAVDGAVAERMQMIPREDVPDLPDRIVFACNVGLPKELWVKSCLSQMPLVRSAKPGRTFAGIEFANLNE